MSEAPAATESIVDGVGTVDLAAGPYTARFLPGVGMVGSSLTHAGDEYVSFHGGVDDYRAGHPTGIPLLHPWANRLSRFTYEASGVWVDFDDTPPVHVSEGLPIHGTMAATDGWQVEAVLADSTRALLQARFVFGNHPARLRSFPFPHELIVFVELSDLGLRVTTEIRNTGVRAVPVSFGWHPYFVLPGVGRRETSVVLPDREQLELDGRKLPTGATKQRAESVTVLGDGALGETFDDCYRLLDAPSDRVLAIEATEPHDGPRRRLAVEIGPGYSHAQVYAPADQRVVALEPMTAPIDALVSGDHRIVAPDERFSATFVVRVETIESPDPADNA